MHPNANTRRPRLWGLVLALGLIAVAVGQAQEPPVIPAQKAKVDRTGALIVPLGGSVEFDPASGQLITDIFNRNEDILQVRPAMDPKVIVMTGRNPGLSQVTLTFANRAKAVYDVVVQPDYDLLRSVIKRTVPTASVEVIPGVGNVIILSGYVTRPEDADIIMRITSSAVGGSAQNIVNALQVGGVQQVQIDVVIASVNRTELRSRGFDVNVNGTVFQFNSLIGGLLLPPAGNAAMTAGSQFSPEANLQFSVVPSQFFGALRALRTEGVAKLLTEPRVVTQTGRPAFFRSGGQQATVGPAAGITGPGTVLVPFGTELEVLPIVYGNNKIWLEVNPRISRPDFGLGITINGAATPGFAEQQVRSAVMLESGQTFAIGGLIENTKFASSSRVPVLGDIPYLGTAFSRVTHSEVESELIILVTPRLVEALDCNQVPRRLPGQETRSPDDYELFLEGILEAPRGQRKVWNGHCYNAAYKCDPTYGTFPCAGNVCGGGGTAAGGAPGCNTGSCPAPGAIPYMPAPFTMPMPAAPVPQATSATVQTVSVTNPPTVESISETVPGSLVGEPTIPQPLPPQGQVAPGN